MMPLFPDRMNTLREYFLMEALDKAFPQEDHKFMHDFRIASSEMPSYHPKVPKQTNGTDCGLFLLENVETFLSNPKFILDNLNQKEGSG